MSTSPQVGAAKKALEDLRKSDPFAYLELVRQLAKDLPSGKEKADAQFVSDPWPELIRLQTLADENPILIGRDLEARLNFLDQLDKCSGIQLLGIWAQVLRSHGELDLAHEVLAKAYLHSEDCLYCLADLDKRTSILLQYQGEYERACEKAMSSIAAYRDLGGAGHDLYGFGLATSLVVASGAEYHAERPRKGIELSQEAIDILPSDGAIFGMAVGNLAANLAASGQSDDLKMADDKLRVCNVALRGLSRVSAPQARLKWLTSMIRSKIGSEKKYRTLRRLEACQKAFLRLELPNDAAAVVADRCHLIYPDRHQISGVAVEAISLFHDEVTVKFLRGIGKSAALSGWHAPEALRLSIRDLRQSCSGVLPCLLT